MYLRGKYPYKHNAEIKEICDAKMNGYIFEDECFDIIKYMYNNEDSETILQKLKKHFMNGKEKTIKENKKLSREEQAILEQEKEKHKIEFILFQKVSQKYFFLL